MMTKMENPWLHLSIGALRRIDAAIPLDMFWIKTEEDNYGLYIKTNQATDNSEQEQILKGIKVIKKSNIEGRELLLLLVNKFDWEIFLALCNDLTSASRIHSTAKESFNEINSRLNKWQKLLMQDGDIMMSKEKQMGLFTELSLLKDVLFKEKGFVDSIEAWTGPDKDKQDFNFADRLIEVKSYISSKGPFISISSAHQLLVDSKPMYLATFGLTISNTGISLKDLIWQINELLNDISPSTLVKFQNKLSEYGYIHGYKEENLTKFKIDSIRVFENATEFPKISPTQIATAVVKLNYTIDLELCKAFERTLIDLTT